ncbi:MAG: hypothetical protein ACW98X_27290, partial [Promethearchaeota archaeon]
HKESHGKMTMSRVTNTYLLLLIGLILGFMVADGISAHNQDKKLDDIDKTLLEIKKLIKDGK